MAINERLIHTAEEAAANGDAAASAGQNLILHLDANDVDSYDGDGSVWYDISEHDVTIPLSDNADDLKLHLNASDTTSYDPATDTTTWTDISGNSNDATLTSLTNTDHDIDNGGYFDLDGSSDSVSVSHNSAFNSSTDISFEVWVNRDGTTEDTIISKGTSASNNYFFIYSPSNGYYYYNYVSGGGVKTGTSGLSTGKWEHVVVSIDSSGNRKIYVNGEDKSTAVGSVGTTDTTDTGALNIGGANGYTATGQGSFGGKIGAVRIYSKKLSASEVGQNYRHGRDYIYTGLTDKTNVKVSTSDYSSISSTSNHPTSAPGLSDTSTTASIHTTTKVLSYGETGNSANTNHFTVTMDNAFAATGFAVYERYQSNYRYTGTVDLYGSNDNTNFTKLGTTVQTTSVQYNRNETTFNNTTDYLYYKFDLHSNGRGKYQSAWAVELFKAVDLSPELHLDAGDSSTTSSNWDDLSSNSYGETLTGVSYDEELGNWFTFTGGSEHRVSIDDDGALTNVDDFTVEMWANIKDNNAYRYLWSNMDTTNSKRQVYAYVTNDDKIEFTVYSGNGSTTYRQWRTSSVASTIHNEWVHYSFVLSSGTPSKLYLNGVDTTLTAQTAGGGWGGSMHKTSTTDFAIGNNQNTGNTTSANGDIGQFRIYHDVLTADQVMQNYLYTKNNYPNDYHMTITNAVFNSSGYFDFDGSGDYMQNNDLADYFDGKDEFAVSAWFKSSHTGSDGQVIWSFSDNTAGSTECACQLRSNQIQCFNRISGSHSAGPNFYSGSGMGNNAWHHFVYQGDSTGTKIYIDNTEITNRTFHDSTNANDVVSFAGMNKFNIGANDDSSAGLQSYFDGQISKLKVYDRTLTTSEISAIYNEGE